MLTYKFEATILHQFTQLLKSSDVDPAIVELLNQHCLYIALCDHSHLDALFISLGQGCIHHAVHVVNMVLKRVLNVHIFSQEQQGLDRMSPLIEQLHDFVLVLGHLVDSVFVALVQAVRFVGIDRDANDSIT